MKLFYYTDMSSEFDSSFADALYWDSETNTLAILRDESTGCTLFYDDVPARIYYGMVDSNSVGRYYNENIRDRYYCHGTHYGVKFEAKEDLLPPSSEVRTPYVVRAIMEDTFFTKTPEEAARQMMKLYPGIDVKEVVVYVGS